MRQLPFPLPDPHWTASLVGSIGEHSPQSDDGTDVRDVWLSGTVGEVDFSQSEALAAERVKLACVAISEVIPVLVATSTVSALVATITETEEVLTVRTWVEA